MVNVHFSHKPGFNMNVETVIQSSVTKFTEYYSDVKHRTLVSCNIFNLELFSPRHHLFYEKDTI